ncbi:hypothetical protein AB205_0145450 [Aquarana catesbeiana]|uniref:Scaffold protein ILK n=1 Tax=Aquarana catesbeiana TaxID=8400 RepID=A0A2G9R5D7_AQUCT|nr:hypothetical protein AB205_0145450 [Aquarana catesbeiana]
MDDIFTQCREGNAVAVRLWLDNTENDLNQGDDHGFSPLHWACREGRSNIVDMLIMRGARINVMNRGDDTPLHLAASHGHRDIVQKLIQQKADVNAVNEHGNSPLHYACFWGQDEVAEDLVNNNSLIYICNKYGETPLDKAKPHLKELLRDRAEKMGQAMSRIPYKDTFWKGTTRTRPHLVVDQCQAVKFGLDIARGMAFLHTLEPLIPRHYLNSRSVMIDEDMTARVSMADVKLSFQCPGRMYSPAWIAPEALQKRPEDINRRSADMWSFAVLLWELVTREVPFADLSNMEIGMKVSLEGLRPTIPPGISPHICKLMKICMNEDPAKRPKFDMIVPILEKMQDK